MTELLSPPVPVRGRPFVKGRSGNPTGRRYGSRNKNALAAAVLLEGESEALTRKAVELALAGDPTALRLCIERIVPPCRERPVKFTLPPIENAADIAAVMIPRSPPRSPAVSSHPARRSGSRMWSTPSLGRSLQPKEESLL